MAEYIKREAVLEWFRPYTHEDILLEPVDVISEIRGIPAADAVEVVHGEWVIERSPVEAEFKCSECDYLYIDADSYAKEKYNYCPNCGAKMDGERKEKDA